VSPRLVLRHALPCAPPAIEVVGEPEDFVGAALAVLDAPVPLPTVRQPSWERPGVRDRRGGGIAGIVGALVHSGEPVLLVVADAVIRARQLAPIVGPARLCSHEALRAHPGLADDAHVVLVDPPVTSDPVSASPGRMVHLVWGDPEVDFSLRIHEREHGLRAPLSEIYRALRDREACEGEELEAALRGDPQAPRTAALAGRALRVLAELGLVHLDREARAVTVPTAERTSLERSAWYRSEQVILDEGRRWLTRSTAQAA
jgi:single-stranded-DNA-specific exonuclease